MLTEYNPILRTEKMDKIFHIVVRFSDTMFSVGDVIDKHNNLVNRYGAVWFGKLGVPVSDVRIEKLNAQIGQDIPTLLYLAKGSRKKLTVFKARLISISSDFPKDKTLIPEYYKEKKLLEFIKTWMKIGQIEAIEISAIASLRALGSMYPITKTLALSSAGHFLVHESKSIF